MFLKNIFFNLSFSSKKKEIIIKKIFKLIAKFPNIKEIGSKKINFSKNLVCEEKKFKFILLKIFLNY